MKYNIILILLFPIVVISCSKQKGLGFIQEEIIVRKGEVIDLNEYIYPESKNNRLIWMSSDNDIAIVTSKGQLLGLYPGVATVSVKDNNVYASCNVIVEKASPESVSVDEEEIILFKNDSYRLNISVSPTSFIEDVIVTSSNPDIIEVIGDVIKAKGLGECVIRVACEDVSDSCRVIVNSIPQIGDYCYSDGTFSSVIRDDMAPVGVVFWLGDITLEDMILANEHSYCTHGLVLSVYGNELSPWQENYGQYGNTVGQWIEENTAYTSINPDNSDDIDVTMMAMGYNNTKAIRAFNSHQGNNMWPVNVVALVDEMQNKLLAPSKSSGWYLPSIKELSLLAEANADNYLNDRLDDVPEADLLQPIYYWSSNEYTENYAYDIDFGNNGKIYVSMKNTPGDGVRMILAF